MAEPRIGDVVFSAEHMEPHRVERVDTVSLSGRSMAGAGARKRRFRLRDLEKVDEGLYQEMTRG